jgi:stearoyl-CoA desaturase (delta-9 desaturase)
MACAQGVSCREHPRTIQESYVYGQSLLNETASVPTSPTVAAEPAACAVEPEPVPLAVLVTNFLAVTVPFAGLLGATVMLWGWGVSWVELSLLVGIYLVTALGITVGFHRLFTHRAFETNLVVKFLLGVFGSMAVQGPLIRWVAMHRWHHAHSDRHGDPHSPHLHGSGLWGTLRGLWHAHMGWFFLPDPPDLARYVRDLRASPMLRMVSALFPVWVIAGLLIPAALGGLLTGSWLGMLGGLAWGGLVRIFLVHHVTWSVNSVCHLWGRRPFRSGDHSRNNFLFGILALGEGWHNSHHAFPTSARHGLRWWEIDISYGVIRVLALLRLAWDVRVPTKQVQQRQRRA